MRCWMFFPNMMVYVFIDPINSFVNRLHVQKNDKKNNSTLNDPVDF